MDREGDRKGDRKGDMKGDMKGRKGYEGIGGVIKRPS